MTLHDLAQKDVIQIKTGENLGRVDDVLFDEGNAKIQSLVLHGRGHLFGLLGYDEDLIIPWDTIHTIGADVIMVDAEPLPVQRQGKRCQ